ncbi:MAG: hypothetical protein KC731_19775 [Myxococcales bacterium]|nr:hypothetical protein [Myxococcales bacterium]
MAASVTAALVASGCGGPDDQPIAALSALHLVASAAFRERCPATLDSMKQALQRGAFPQPTRVSRRTPEPR